MLGITALNGDLVICVIIFAGMKSRAVMETSMAIFIFKRNKLAMIVILKRTVGKQALSDRTYLYLSMNRGFLSNAI